MDYFKELKKWDMINERRDNYSLLSGLKNEWTELGENLCKIKSFKKVTPL